MAKDDPANDGPSLEMPSLGFGRKRRKKSPAPEAETPGPPAEDQPTEDQPTEVLAPEVLAPEVLAPEPAPEPAPVPAPEPAPVPAPEPAPPLFVDEVEPPIAPAPARPELVPSADQPPADEPEVDQPPTEEPEVMGRPRRELPPVGAMTASIITGLLVGIITVGLTWASLHLCEVVQGTSSCGNPGFFLLAAIMIVSILLGTVLLKAWRVSDPGSTSILAVGLMAVLALLFLVDVLFSPTMIIVIPLIAAATFALAHWVTTAFIEPAEH